MTQLYIGNSIIDKTSGKMSLGSVQAISKADLPTSISIPAGVTKLVDGCCKSLSITSVTIPNSVEVLGKECFAGCEHLTTVVLPEGLTVLDESCFCECYDLTSINIPSTTTVIGSSCFYNCWNIPSSIIIPAPVTTLGENCFMNCSGIESVDIQGNITSLPGGCFDSCSSLASINIPDSVTSLGAYCFRGCPFTDLSFLPDTITSIGEHCFEDCTGLTTITLPASLEHIGACCFGYLENITGEIVFPATLKTLGDDLFHEGGSNISALRFMGDPPTFDNPPFFGPCNGDWENGVVTVYYKADNLEWTEEVKQDFVERSGIDRIRFESF